MDLNNKSKENIKLCEMCIHSNKFLNVSGSRIYYALFQKLKYILQHYNYNYEEFLNQNNGNEINRRERPYSHGTIRYAFADFLQNRFNKGGQIMLLIGRYYREIYRFRITADYENYECTKDKYEEYLKNVKEILNEIEKIVEL